MLRPLQGGDVSRLTFEINTPLRLSLDVGILVEELIALGSIPSLEGRIKENTML